MKYLIIILSVSLLECSELNIKSPTDIHQISAFCSKVIDAFLDPSVHKKSKLFFGKSLQDKNDRTLFFVLMDAVRKRKESPHFSKIRTKKHKWGIKILTEFNKHKALKRLNKLLSAVQGKWYLASIMTYQQLQFAHKSLTHALYEKERSFEGGASINASEHICIRNLSKYFGLSTDDVDSMIQLISSQNGTSVLAILGSHKKNMLYLCIDEKKSDQIQDLFKFNCVNKYL